MVNMKTDIKAIEKQLKQLLTTKLYEHSIGTAKQAKELAQHWHMGGQKAYLAGLLHDHAKSHFVQEYVALAVVNDIPVDSWLLDHPDLLHAPIGAALLSEEWNIHDSDIKAAIANHTIATEDMSDFAKIIYLADKIEPNRKEYPAMARIKELAFSNLDAAMAESIASGREYLTAKGKDLHPNTKDIEQFYRNKVK